MLKFIVSNDSWLFGGHSSNCGNSKIVLNGISFNFWRASLDFSLQSLEIPQYNLAIQIGLYPKFTFIKKVDHWSKLLIGVHKPKISWFQNGHEVVKLHNLISTRCWAQK